MDDDLWSSVVVYETPDEMPRPSRRRILSGALALASTTAFALIAGGRSSRVSAATEYFHCAGYDNFKGYSDNSSPCVGAEYSRTYCDTRGWFANRTGTCYSQWPIVLCGDGNGYAPANAWRWTHGGTPYRCADGHVQTCGGGGPVLRICSYSNP